MLGRFFWVVHQILLTGCCVFGIMMAVYLAITTRDPHYTVTYKLIVTFLSISTVVIYVDLLLDQIWEIHHRFSRTGRLNDRT